MTSRSEPVPPSNGPLSAARRTVLAASAAAALSAWVSPLMAQPSRKPHAMPHAVLDFDETTWAQLLAKSPRPAAYLFTTTYCPNCPDAFDKVMAFVMQARRPVELAVVVMDVQGKSALVHAHHYRGASRLYAFDGFEPAIRQSVDPKWPKVTPYVVLLGRDGSVQRSIGAPEEPMLKQWLS